MLDPAVRHLMHQFKYHGWRRLAERFAAAMVPLMDHVHPDADLVPVPLAARRWRQRGYNQAAELASALGRRTGRAVAVWRIGRQRETATQTRLATAQRRANLAGAFAARAAERPVVLVDDVFTTGATLLSAASALLDAGAIRVEAVTFARAQPPLAGLARHLSRPK
jgi:ComF family protein